MDSGKTQNHLINAYLEINTTYPIYMNPRIVPVIFSLLLFSCKQSPKETLSHEQIAANEQVIQYMNDFEGRGVQADDSEASAPADALANFHFPKDIHIELLAHEPLVVQPVELNFDHRGRLWVVQYSQYPFPKGLKIVNYDYHLRAQFDKIPEPPPIGIQGADKITMLEDTDGDGVYDKATDAITGLNIATSLTWGRGQIWVLNPPYLLAYPDPDGDGIPNGKAVVHLAGFGLEDTHAVANSLRWGPDGWLYGAQGSTTLANISSSVSQNVSFKGQAIWRYHPETEIFEIYAEGGGNTFHVEIDEKGRVYSGHNGGQARGQYYKQGAYYIKNWGKHGALTNPYAFGFLQHMELEGDTRRFTHAFVKYEGGNLPERYQHKMIAINPLHNYVQVSTFEAQGSSFRNTFIEQILHTEDHWFRPVDIKVGPDGGVYLADWYDSRLSHIDPRDTWHKSSGRIYRIKGSNSPKVPSFDLSKNSTDELVELLSHPNKWFRQQALRQFGDRKDVSVIPKLKEIIQRKEGQIALEALWALNLSGGFEERFAEQSLVHKDPFVRMWTVRLLGDLREISDKTAKFLSQQAQKESHAEVRSQLAATAKRLNGKYGLELVKNLVKHKVDVSDPHIPLQIWWALEDKAETNRQDILALFKEPSFWDQALVKEFLLERIMQRYIMAGGKENYAMCTALLQQSPSSLHSQLLMNGLHEGLRGKALLELPQDLAAEMDKNQPKTAPLSLSLRQEKSGVLDKALARIADPTANQAERLNYIQILGEVHQVSAVPVLLTLISDNNTSGALRQAAILTLKRYNQSEIGEKILAWYPDKLRADPDVRAASLELFASRASWASQFLNRISVSKQINESDVPLPIVRQMKLLGNAEITRQADIIWPDYKLASAEKKSKKLSELKQLLRTETGNPTHGKTLYQKSCGACHRLFGEGGEIGPDLTGYDRRNIQDLLMNILDPNAEIREGYVNYKIITQDDRTLSGIIADQSSEFVRLRQYSGQELTLSTQQIQEMQALPLSLMPERLLDPLSDQEIKDLFAYLMKHNAPQ